MESLQSAKQTDQLNADNGARAECVVSATTTTTKCCTWVIRKEKRCGTWKIFEEVEAKNSPNLAKF